MKYGISITTAPTAEPVLLDEAKDQCGIARGISYHDQRLRMLIEAARRKVEDDTGRATTNRTIDFAFDCWPVGLEPIYLPVNPVSSVTHVKYFDTSNVEQTFSAVTGYKTLLTREPGEIRLKYGQQWPYLYSEAGVITVRFVAGYSADYQSVPDGLRAACLMVIQHLWENEPLPDNYWSLVNQHRVGDDCHAYAR